MGYRIVRGGMTYTEIAEVLGISRQNVRIIEAKALRKLRNSGKLDDFKELAGDNWREPRNKGRNVEWESLT